MYPNSSERLNRETDEEVYFFTPSFHCFDNFSAHQVSIWGINFPTAEHAFQWKKFSEVRPDLAANILAARSPEAAKHISDANKSNQPENWSDVRVGVMEEILGAKTEQHDDVKDALKRSGRRKIIENSPIDRFWGIGPDGTGANMVGKIWMKIRANYINMSRTTKGSGT